MHVSLKDKENTLVKQRISQLIEPIKTSRVAASRSQRKVLQELFPADDNHAFERDSIEEVRCEQNIAFVGSDTKSTRRVDCRYLMSDSKVVDGKNVAVLERELSQTRAVARLEEGNLHRKLEDLNDRFVLLEQENSSLMMHNRRLKERCETQQTQVYELERRLIDREAELAKEFEGKMTTMASVLQQKEIELLDLRTNSSKYRVDTTCDLGDAHKQIDVLRQQLAQKDCRLAQLETNYSLERVELEAKMLQLIAEAKEAEGKAELKYQELHTKLEQAEGGCIADRVKIKELEGQLEASFLKYKQLKADWNELSEIKSEKEALERNEKKLVRRCQLLEQQILDKNERVNEIILNYQNEIEGLKKQLSIQIQRPVKREVPEELKAKLTLLEVQIRDLTEDKKVNTIRLASSARELEHLGAEIARIKEMHCCQLRIKEDKIALLDRQLSVRDQEIQRLRSNKSVETSATGEEIFACAEYQVSYHMHQKETVRRTQEPIPHSTDKLQQKATITRLELQLDSVKHSLQSAEQQLRLQSSQIVEMEKVIESQLITLRQTKRIIDDKEESLSEKQRIVARLQNENKRHLAIVIELEMSLKQEESCRSAFIERYGLTVEPLTSAREYSQEGSASHKNIFSPIRTFYNRLRQRMAELESLRCRFAEASQQTLSLERHNASLTSQNRELSIRIEELQHNQKLNESLIIRIEEESKAQVDRIRSDLELKYEVLYEKYMKYRRILQKEKERKELQKAIIKDSNQFNNEIVERCKQLIR